MVVIATVAALAPSKAELVERWFTGGFYPPLQRALTPLSNLMPFAWLDVFAVAALIWFVRLWLRAVRRDPDTSRAARLGRAAFLTAVSVAVVYLVFLAVWGLNYRRVPLAAHLVMDRDVPDTDGVVALGMVAAERLNTLHPDAHRAGWAEPVWQDAALVSAAVAVQQRLGHARGAVPARLKSTVFGPVFRWNGVDGMINPFGLEVLANPDLLPFERPFVAAHEWAHLAGYADEAEANFVGWLTCLSADVPSQYSGWLYLYWQIAGELGSDRRKAMDAALREGPRLDLNAIAERLRRGDLPLLRRFSWAAYDRYLKANRVEEGIRSYGEVVTLILRARFEDGWNPVLRRER